MLGPSDALFSDGHRSAVVRRSAEGLGRRARASASSRYQKLRACTELKSRRAARLGARRELRLNITHALDDSSPTLFVSFWRTPSRLVWRQHPRNADHPDNHPARRRSRRCFPNADPGSTIPGRSACRVRAGSDGAGSLTDTATGHPNAVAELSSEPPHFFGPLPIVTPARAWRRSQRVLVGGTYCVAARLVSSGSSDFACESRSAIRDEPGAW